MIILRIFLPAATSLTMVIHILVSLATVDHVVRLLFSDTLVLVLLSMVTKYFNGCACACSLGIAAQIKFMGDLH
jgi:hypothetical protein